MKRIGSILLLGGLFIALLQAAFTSHPTVHAAPGPRYVFLFIGDGMGLAQINAAETFMGAQVQRKPPSLVQTAFTAFPATGFQTTYSLGSYVPDSSSTATAMATGHKVGDGALSLDMQSGKPYPTLAELAAARGMKVGIVTSVALNHATPAAFYAHQANRDHYYAIGLDLVNSPFQYFAGGGLLDVSGPAGQQTSLTDIAQGKGFTIVHTAEAFAGLTSASGRAIVLHPDPAPSQSLPYEIDRKGSGALSLADLTQKGIDFLDNPNGFLMIVEGGKIDWAAHANDTATLAWEVLSLNDAVLRAVQFANQHPTETLIVVTGDHETGGLALGARSLGYQTRFGLLAQQKISFEALDGRFYDYQKEHTVGQASLQDWLPTLGDSFGLATFSEKELTELQSKAENGDEAAWNRYRLALTAEDTQELLAALQANLQSPPGGSPAYGGREPFSATLTDIMSRKVGAGWSTQAHTGVPVPVFASGNGSAQFVGYYDNADLFERLATVMQLAAR